MNFKNNYNSPNNNRDNKSNNRSQNSSKPTVEEQVIEIKTKYFSKTYDELLIITDNQQDISLDEIYSNVSKFVEEKCKVVSTSQLRNIYGRIVKIDNINSLKMLRPKLAYVAARQPNTKAIIMFFDGLIKNVNTEEKLKSFKIIMEAVVAYHKFHHNNK